MSWPDDNAPRYVVDAQPSVRVLDRAYCHRIVSEWTEGRGGSYRQQVVHAERLAAALNASDAREDEAA